MSVVSHLALFPIYLGMYRFARASGVTRMDSLLWIPYEFVLAGDIKIYPSAIC